ARNGEIPKIQTPLFGTMRHAALSDLFVQTFPSSPAVSNNTVTSIMEKSSDQCGDYPRSRSRRQCERVSLALPTD
ncbi:hypothetical protein, partial [Xanthomonas citri]|uniref:hypothetical protein n=1 Tax=Xanthomonas citri TaxID=346 RepID=UPI001CA48B05